MTYRCMIVTLCFVILLISVCDCIGSKKVGLTKKKGGHRERQSSTETRLLPMCNSTFWQRKKVTILVTNVEGKLNSKSKSKTKITGKCARAAPIVGASRVTTPNPRLLRKLRARPTGKVRHYNKLAPMPYDRTTITEEITTQRLVEEKKKRPKLRSHDIKLLNNVVEFTKSPKNQVPGVLIQGDVTGAWRELQPIRHPYWFKKPPSSDSVRRHWPTEWPCPPVDTLVPECEPPRDQNFYPQTETKFTCTGDFTFTHFYGNFTTNWQDVILYYTDTTVYRPRVTCTSPTSTPIMSTYLCPTTSPPMPWDPHCNFSCQFPSTTGCCTDPTSTCSEPTSTEKPFDCCTDPTSTPYNPPLFVVTCYEITDPTTTRLPCKCYKVLEFTLTKDECMTTCTPPTSTCTPPTTTCLPSTRLCLTACRYEHMINLTSIRPYINPVIPCECLSFPNDIITTCIPHDFITHLTTSSSVQIPTTVSLIQIPDIVEIPNMTTSIQFIEQPTSKASCIHVSRITPITVCRKHFVRDVNAELQGDYALTFTTMLGTSCFQDQPVYSLDSYFNFVSSSTHNPFNSLCSCHGQIHKTESNL